MFNSPPVPAISAQATYDRLINEDTAAQPIIVDVREPDEWAEGHIEEAQHIPLGQLGARVREIPQDREVILVCHSGQRSAMATTMLLRAGYTRAVNMTGGMDAWERQHLPIARS